MLYRPAQIEKSSDISLSCSQAFEEFEYFREKEDKIAADARLITGNRFTEYLIVPLYFIYPVLLIRSSGGNDHNVSKAEYSYICRQASLLRLMKQYFGQI